MDSSSSFLRRPTEAPWSTLKFVKVIGEGRFGTVWLCEDGRTSEQYACKKVLKASLKDSLLHQHFLRQEVALLDFMTGKHPNIVELKFIFEDSEAIYLLMEYCDVGDLFSYVTSNGACTVPGARSSSSSCSGGIGGFGLSSIKSGGKVSGGENSSSSSNSKQRSGLSWGLPENKAVLIFRQLAHAVLYCHRNGVVHRDIKLENVLLSTPLNSSVPQYYYSTSLPSPSLPKQPGTASDARVLAKLADFGLAVRLAPGEKTVGTAGSRPYEAPEVILGQEYDTKADVWSLGVLLFGMLSCSMPFQGSGERQLTRQIIRGNVDMSRGAWSAVSAEAKDLIRAMLTVNPDERISMAEVVTHPWIKAASRRRKPVITTSSLTELDFANVTSGGVSPGYFGSLTPTSPLFPMKSPFGGRRKKVASTSDLPSLYPCNKDDGDRDGKDNTSDEEDGNNNQKLEALGRANKRSAGFFEINADQEDSDTSSRNMRSGNQEKENSLPPLHPKTPRGCAADAALGLSVVLPDEMAGGSEKHSGKSSIWDSFLPALSPSRRKWRVSF
ncbi:unnamed protein product [Closterium sp. Yama58-4]|nr:unnamed protein product [Closterium sp. Yama58-4]